MTGPDHAAAVPLTDPDELLLRQVHPDEIQEDGRPASSAFRAQPSHSFMLSTRREHIGARTAYDDWKSSHESAGTFGVPIEAIADSGLTAFDDSADPALPDGHASIDFRGMSNAAIRKAAQKLRSRACEVPLPLNP